MSNFNEYFKNQGAKILVDRFFRGAKGVDYTNTKVKIVSLTHSIVDEPSHPASYYVENGLTATHKVRVEYTTTMSDEVLLTEFEVPKEIDGIFIIEGAYRLATNKLGSDYNCRINMSGTGDYIINFDFNRRYDINKRILKIKKTDADLSLLEKEVKIKYEDIDSISGEDKELLKLSEDQQKKFEIKLDLDYKPEYITTKLIDDCLAFGDDRLKDLIIDKTIESVPKSFMQFMFRAGGGTRYYAARRNMSNYFQKHNKLQEQSTAITNLAIRFFKGSSDNTGDSGIQVPPGINAINLQSIGDKITIHKTVAYNSTFADLIDD